MLKEEVLLWLRCAGQRGVIIRAIIVAIIVGTCITFVNSGGEIIRGKSVVAWQVCLNFVVPCTITVLMSCMTKIVALKDLSDCPIEVGTVRHLVLEKGVPEAVYIALSKDILIYYAVEP
eukprot:TRINITY_DN6647_c0_g1_i1.p3 TRINITY_DN6647_c0_g1~~TRINITY_DN6647_c0_g1_i1.p3  ORF type:complete len:119 (-),score=19.04 TRINITY_DN6647_c0_g1_i1:481-837(-)